MSKIIRKEDRKYLFVLLVLFGILFWVSYNAPKPLNWQRTYSNTDKIPYGSYLFFEVLEELFESPVTENHRTFFENKQQVPGDFYPQNAGDSLVANAPKSAALYMIVCEKFLPDSLDTRALLHTLNAGNEVFLATTQLSDFLADTLKLQLERLPAFSTFSDETPAATDSIGLRLTAFPDSNYVYFKAGIGAFYLQNFDTASTYILGKNSLGAANFVRIPVGKGNLWLHTAPLVYTNYHLLQASSRTYLENALSHLPRKAIIWDEYYKKTRKKAGTPLRFVLSTPSLRLAYYTLIGTLLLFILFESKRRQRKIPVFSPPKNTSLEFVETIGNLYFQQKNHTDLAKKKIQFFDAHLRNTFYVNPKKRTQKDTEKIAARTEMTPKKVENLLQKIDKARLDKKISENGLKTLSEAIENFMQNGRK